MRNSSSQTAPVATVMRDVSLKAIPKKTVEGNEENAWSEMPVLQDLADQPNVVRLISLALLPSPSFLPSSGLITHPCRRRSSPTFFFS